MFDDANSKNKQKIQRFFCERTLSLLRGRYLRVVKLPVSPEPVTRFSKKYETT